ncbi:MAG: hypothetical protein GY814_02955 [Gammaproteobacteria bacterium]|nr:hypothetical protein [Gammaproteobacteria bacterium]
MRDLTLADMFDSVFDLETHVAENHIPETVESILDQIEEVSLFDDDYEGGF